MFWPIFWAVMAWVPLLMLALIEGVHAFLAGLLCFWLGGCSACAGYASLIRSQRKRLKEGRDGRPPEPAPAAPPRPAEEIRELLATSLAREMDGVLSKAIDSALRRPWTLEELRGRLLVTRTATLPGWEMWTLIDDAGAEVGLAHVGPVVVSLDDGRMEIKRALHLLVNDHSSSSLTAEG